MLIESLALTWIFLFKLQRLTAVDIHKHSSFRHVDFFLKLTELMSNAVKIVLRSSVRQDSNKFNPEWTYPRIVFVDNWFPHHKKKYDVVVMKRSLSKIPQDQIPQDRHMALYQLPNKITYLLRCFYFLSKALEFSYNRLKNLLFFILFQYIVCYPSRFNRVLPII